MPRDGSKAASAALKCSVWSVMSSSGSQGAPQEPVAPGFHGAFSGAEARQRPLQPVLSGEISHARPGAANLPATGAGEKPVYRWQVSEPQERAVCKRRAPPPAPPLKLCG